MKDKDLNLLQEAYTKVHLKEEYNMDEVPSDQEMEQALQKYYNQKDIKHDEFTKKIFNLKSLKSFLEQMKSSRDEWNSSYPDTKSTIASEINSLYSDSYKETHGIRMNAGTHYGNHPLIDMAFSYFSLYIGDQRKEQQRQKEREEFKQKRQEASKPLDNTLGRALDKINK
jgi:hypothetical protein